MLDAESMCYMELSRAAAILALRLGRVASGCPRDDDHPAIEEVAAALDQFLSTPNTPASENATATSFPLFATAEGLEVTFAAMSSSDLKSLEKDLRTICKAITEGTLEEKNIQKSAEKLRDLFLRLEKQAEGRAAIIEMGGPNLERLVAADHGR